MNGGKLVQLTTQVRNPDGYKVQIEKKDCQEERDSQVVKKVRKK